MNYCDLLCFFVCFLFDGYRQKSDECEKIARLETKRPKAQPYFCSQEWLNTLARSRLAPELQSRRFLTLSLFLILHDVSLSLSVYGYFLSLSVPLHSLLSSSNSCVVPHPLSGHTISSLGSSRGNTFCVRSALEVSHNLLCSLSSSFLLYTAPCREIFSCFFFFIPPISLSACGLELFSRLDVSRWSFSLSSQCVFAVMMRRTVAVLLSQAFYTSMNMLYKLLNCQITIESSRL